MRIVHISDTHNRHNRIKIPECDVLIHSGDFSGMGRHTEVESFIKWFSRQPATYRIFISGNHDINLDESKNDGRKPDWLQELIYKYEMMGSKGDDRVNFYLEDTGCEIWGVKFWGSPITPTFGRPIWGFNRDRGDDIKRHWDKIPETDVLITHGPPHGVLDWVPHRVTTNGTDLPGGNRGCADLRLTVHRIKPKYHLFGHIHEGYGHFYDHYLNVHYFNGSMVDMQYDPVNTPHIFEVNLE